MRREKEETFSILHKGEERLLVIEPAALNVLLKYRQQRRNQKESGGVLIGERRGLAIVIQQATRPGKLDKKERFGFIRNGLYHQKFIDEAYKRTSGTSNYIGEWHTHPQDIASPSSIDYSNWSTGLKGMDVCIVAVVGNKESWWGLHDAGQYTQFKPM
jgi:integrative and conjugative element protein (TIGR02256 family)